MECRHKFTMCRLCLCESESFIDIFQVNEWFGYVTAEVIRDLLQFQVSEVDGYPHVVCSICLRKLTDFKQFKEKCQDSRDTYNDMFASDESHAEHPIDIEELSPVKFEPKDPLDTQEVQQEVPSASIKAELEEGTNDVDTTSEVGPDRANLEEEETITDGISLQVEPKPVKSEPKDPLDTQEAQKEIRKWSVAFTPLEYLSLRWKRTCCKSYGQYESTKNSVNVGGKPLSKKMKKVAFDANPRENTKSSGSPKMKFGDVDIKVRRDCKSPGESIYVLPVEESDINRVESSVGELGREMIKRRENVTCVDAGVDESDGESEREFERERGVEAPPRGTNEREGKKERLKCNDCGKGFREKAVLIRHLELHGYEVNGESSGEEREFQVNTSVNRASKRNGNKVHKIGVKRKMSDKVKRDEGVRKYICDSCGKGFSRIDQMKIHLTVHGREKPFVCAICDKRFSNKSSLRSHKLSHADEKPYTCDVCYKGFTQNNHLVVHRRIHTGETPYICQICGMKFAHIGTLTRHMLVHNGEKSHVCKVCKKCFSVSSNLKVHLRVHTQEKPYTCQVCNMCFSMRSSLKAHLRKHSLEKPYPCQVCNKCFSNGSNLIRHLRIHSQEKPYLCQVCKKCFSDRSNLNVHLRIHSQGKLHACKVCSKCFTTTSNLRRHSRIHSH